jgi:hypothetical protein
VQPDEAARSFHRAWQRRNLIGFAVLGAAVAALGIAFVIVAVVAPDSLFRVSAASAPAWFKRISGTAIGLLIVVFSGLLFRRAARIRKDLVRDPDSEPL